MTALEASRDLSLLAPKFRAAVEAAIADCAAKGFPVKVAEALRSQERQAYLYAQGRTRPGSKVTNAPTNLTSWHGYGLAVDVIHETKGWAPGKNNAETVAWFRSVAAIFKAHGCSAGADWSKPDLPHMQWGNMPASPQASHKALKQQMSNAAVWRAVGAADADFINSESPHVPAPLVRGSKGPKVERLQDALDRAGIHIVSPGEPGYGTFGPKTEQGLMTFQFRKQLVVTGLADAATLAALGLKE